MRSEQSYCRAGEKVYVHGDGKKGQKQIRSGGQAPNGYRLTLHQTGGRLSASREV